MFEATASSPCVYVYVRRRKTYVLKVCGSVWSPWLCEICLKKVSFLYKSKIKEKFFEFAMK